LFKRLSHANLKGTDYRNFVDCFVEMRKWEE